MHYSYCQVNECAIRNVLDNSCIYTTMHLTSTEKGNLLKKKKPFYDLRQLFVPRACHLAQQEQMLAMN